MRALRPTLVLLAALAGCAHPSVFLPPRVESASASAPPLRQTYAALADRLIAHAAFYEREVRKNHVKLRVMGVLSVLGAGGAAAGTASAIHPDMPDATRPAVGAASISLSVFGGVFVLLPHAHQYVLKEAGYQRKAEEVRAEGVALEGRCADGVPDRDDLACVRAAEDALARARRFPLDSPCKPPPEGELDRMIERARAAR